MKTSRLADKKIKHLQTDLPEIEFEIAIRNALLYNGLAVMNGFIPCTGENLWLVAHRAWYYGITIIGIESNIDENIPYFDCCIENYVEDVINFGENNPTHWILTALMPITISYPGIHLKFYIDIPEMNIPILEKTIGMESKP